jgi:hypothetical protein
VQTTGGGHEDVVFKVPVELRRAERDASARQPAA